MVAALRRSDGYPIRQPSIATRVENRQLREGSQYAPALAIIFVVLWLLGLVTSYTLGGFIHILLIIAAVGASSASSASGASNNSQSKAKHMNSSQIAGAVLVVAGILGLAYGSFSYTKETHQAKLGPIELSVKERETVNVPVWAGGGAIVAGAQLLLLGRGKG